MGLNDQNDVGGGLMKRKCHEVCRDVDDDWTLAMPAFGVPHRWKTRLEQRAHPSTVALELGVHQAIVEQASINSFAAPLPLCVHFRFWQIVLAADSSAFSASTSADL